MRPIASRPSQVLIRSTQEPSSPGLPGQAARQACDGSRAAPRRWKRLHRRGGRAFGDALFGGPVRLGAGVEPVEAALEEVDCEGVTGGAALEEGAPRFR